jgi:acyl-CoA reductase-like NAD-dependent aldehyde dehydrogenase
MKIVEIMEKHASELAALECLDNGKTWDFATNVDVDFAIRTFRYYAGWADKNQGKVSEVGLCSLFFALQLNIDVYCTDEREQACLHSA